MNQQQQDRPSVFNAKQEYTKATLRIYGTVGELTNSMNQMGNRDNPPTNSKTNI
jgi:hypothetical protein